MTNCSKCDCAKAQCGCDDIGLTTNPPCATNTPACPNPEPCSETFDSNCVYYTGEDLDCLGIKTDDTVQEVIQTIAAALEPFFCLDCTTFAVPANAATNIPVNQSLTWNAVQGATSYDVYLGTTSTTLVLVSASQILTTYTPTTPLLEGIDYYWQIVPKNDVGVPKATCPIYKFTTFKFVCTNPITYILEAIESQVGDSQNIATYFEVANSFLQNGLLLTNCDLCCPDCTETNRYVLASAQTYNDYYTSVYSGTCLPPCCVEVDAALIVYTTGVPSLLESFTELPPPTNCCNTKFSECSQRIKTILGPNADDIYNKFGIVEESTINGSTTLCLFADFLENLPSAWTTADKANFLAIFLERGLVIDCRPEGTIITNVKSYIDYLKTINKSTGCLCYEPCCNCFAVKTPIVEIPYPYQYTTCDLKLPIVGFTTGGNLFICSTTVPYSDEWAPGLPIPILGVTCLDGGDCQPVQQQIINNDKLI